MTKPRRPAAPPGLGTAGRALWRSIVATYGLRPDELRVLREAAQLADDIAALEAARDELDSPLTTGSRGQSSVHPIYPELRANRLALNKLLAQLRLPNEADQGKVSASEAGVALVQSRWKRGTG